MAIDDIGEKMAEKQKQQDMDYGYEQEEDKSWLQKIVDYIKQKDITGRHKAKEVT